MKNPYTINGNKKMIPSFVCYADILGYSEKISESLENGDSNTLLKKLQKALGEAYKRIREEKSFFGAVPEFSLKIFTDNLVIGFPVPNYQYNAGEHELGRIYNIFSEYQVNMAMNGLFVRGAITFGDFYMDNNIVFGKPILEAYEIEKEVRFPRIILSSDVKEKLFTQIGFYGNGYLSPQYDNFLIDGDGQIFLNYLDVAFSIFPDGPIFFEILKKHKIAIEENLGNYNSNQHIKEKYEWLGRYQNFICEEIANKYPPSSNPDQSFEHYMASESAQKTLDYLIHVDDGPMVSRLEIKDRFDF